MTLPFILLACSAATLVSMLLAAAVSLVLLSRLVDRMVSFSAGMLLGTALLHLLPESLHVGRVDVHTMTATLLVGLLGFFFLERLSLLRHDHHHEQDGHHHEHGHDAKTAGRGGVNLLI
ncbi:MAG: ZIP family metal transporter, partial [Betaproteobacteria bacterium]|nr:ZIP family metal transporter [Betaproteobacteria bacterium]